MVGVEAVASANGPTAGCSMSRSNIAEVDEWIDVADGDEGRERWCPWVPVFG